MPTALRAHDPLRRLPAFVATLLVALSMSGMAAPSAQATAPSLRLNVTSGAPSSQVTITGNNFTSNTMGALYIADRRVASFRTDSQGRLSSGAVIPHVAAGETRVRASTRHTRATTPLRVLAPSFVAAPAPAVLLSESFTGPDGTFVSSSDFWSSADRGLSKNRMWVSESGAMMRTANAGRTRSDYFRMWTRQNDLRFVKAELDVRFNGFVSGTAGWHGINLWLNKQMCTPVPSCSAMNDPFNKGGNSGYALDFMNRDGSLTILKKVSGDTRKAWPASNIGFVEGGTYYYLAQSTFRPTPGQTYRFGGQVLDNGDGTSTLRVLIDGQVRLQVRDDGRIGGPRLGAGRVGLRSDFADMTVDNLTITR
jgi:hypothetical protein